MRGGMNQLAGPSDEVKASLLRGFYQRAVETEVDREDRTWRLGAGVYIFPEAICPLCGSPMQGKTIWQATEQVRGDSTGVRIEKGYLVAIWKLGRKGLRKMEIRHPNVSGLAICNGSARDTYTALFLSISPTTGYWSETTAVRRWVRDYFGHTCGKNDRVRFSAELPVNVVHPNRDHCGCRNCLEAYGGPWCETCGWRVSLPHNEHRVVGEDGR